MQKLAVKCIEHIVYRMARQGAATPVSKQLEHFEMLEAWVREMLQLSLFSYDTRGGHEND